MIILGKSNPKYKELLYDGWIVTPGPHPDHPDIVNMVNPEQQCCKELNNGRRCLLSLGHKTKRHTSVVFYCDGCGKWRPGDPWSHSYDSNGDPTCDFCWLCCHTRPRYSEEIYG